MNPLLAILNIRLGKKSRDVKEINVIDNDTLEIIFKDNTTSSSKEMNWSKLLVREVIRLVATTNYNAERENKCG